MGVPPSAFSASFFKRISIFRRLVLYWFADIYVEGLDNNRLSDKINS
jgi:hypothetical protein